MRKLYLLLLCALMLPIAAYAHKQHSTDEALSLLHQLKSGGYIIYIRHERTNMHIQDEPDFNMADCTTQRNLSYAGVASAKETGEHLAFLDIPIGDVIASPMCRTKETARYMFGDFAVDERLFGGRHAPGLKSDLLQVIQSRKGKTENVVLVAHISNYQSLFGVMLQEGDAGIIDMSSGEPQHIGTMQSNQWNDLIIDISYLNKHQKM